MKKAFLVGVNKYKQPGSDLQGCVNDVVNMRRLLNEVYNFPLDNIRVLTDDRATKAGIIERLKWLVYESSENDELVFHYSGHGSQVRDRNGDELNDYLDEILCPHDLDWDNPLTDDDLSAIFKELPRYRYLTMICDSCHSGSMTRSFFENPISINPRAPKDKFIVPPMDIQARSEGRSIFKSNMGIKQDDSWKPVGQRHVLLSGCQDNQTSADAYIDGAFQGALTSSLLKVISNNPKATWRDVYKNVKTLLRKNGFSQVPMLSGNDVLLDRNIFGGAN